MVDGALRRHVDGSRRDDSGGLALLDSNPKEE